MSVRPPSGVVAAIESGEAEITRRVELYESDGETRYYPGDSDDQRLVEGSVTVDYGRDERRGIDITLDNQDNSLRPEPNSGLWYDKIIKAFKGATINGLLIQPKIVVAWNETVAEGFEIKSILGTLGYNDITIIPSPTSYDELTPYDLIFVYRKANQGNPWNYSFLLQAYEEGKSVVLQSVSQTTANTPLVWATQIGASQIYSVEQVTGDNPIKDGWTTDLTYNSATSTVSRMLTVTAGARPVAKRVGDVSLQAAIIENSKGGRWFSYCPPGFDSANLKQLLKNAMVWAAHQVEDYEWETQLGEFMIDNISESSRPLLTKITGRDYTKKCLLSKLKTTMQFDPETPISDFVIALAANAGITKFNVPQTQETIGTGMVFDRTTERWKAMTGATEANNFELYFDNFGFLSMRPYLDPVSSPYSTLFQTGAEGNLVDWNRSTNDSRLYNHIIVTGDSGEEGVLPFFGEAVNEEPSSPTRVSRIGDRSYFYTSSFFTSDQQCQDLALRWLKEKALESYEISWSAINYPWLEVGEIVEFLDPRRYDYEPTRFLLDTLTIPMALGPMSATAKRVTYVTDPELM